jgi:hypothetical protein
MRAGPIDVMSQPRGADWLSDSAPGHFDHDFVIAASPV